MCFGSRKSDGGALRSRELDRMIRQDEKRMAKEVKLLLLGKQFPIAGPASLKGSSSSWVSCSTLPRSESGAYACFFDD